MGSTGSLSTLSCNQPSPQTYRIATALLLWNGTEQLLEILVLSFAVCKHCIMTSFKLESLSHTFAYIVLYYC